MRFNPPTCILPPCVMAKPVAPGTGVAHVNVNANVAGKAGGATGLTGHAEAQGVASRNVTAR